MQVWWALHLEGSWSECTSIEEVTIALEPRGESSWSAHLSCSLDLVYSVPRSFSTKSFTLSPRLLCPLHSVPPELRGLGSNALGSCTAGRLSDSPLSGG